MPRIIKLKHPVTAGELTVKEITLNRPKLKDFIAVGAAPLESAASISLLIQSLSGLPANVLDQVDVEDCGKVTYEARYAFNSFFSETEYDSDPKKEGL